MTLQERLACAKKAARARMVVMTPERRSEVARLGGLARQAKAREFTTGPSDESRALAGLKVSATRQAEREAKAKPAPDRCPRCHLLQPCGHPSIYEYATGRKAG